MVQFFAVVLTALALVPGGAHLFELPNKIGLPREGYFTVQGIYRGWALFGFVLFGAVAANLALAVRVRRRRRPFWLVLAVLPGRGAGRGGQLSGARRNGRRRRLARHGSPGHSLGRPCNPRNDSSSQ
jgi:hypothetical protein